jgi:hypothetical protein
MPTAEVAAVATHYIANLGGGLCMIRSPGMFDSTVSRPSPLLPCKASSGVDSAARRLSIQAAVLELTG